MSCLFCLLVVAGLFLFASRDIPPPDVSDLVPERPVIAPEKNGCTYFFTATESFYWPEDKTLVTGYLDGNPLDDAVIQDLLTRNAEAFRLIEKGVSCGVCLTPEVMTYDTQLPYLGPWRNLGRLLALKSRHERLAGDYASATGTCVLLLRFGNLLQKNAECFINYLVGISVLDLGLAQARELASDQTASPEDLKKLAEALAVIEPFDRSMIYAGKAEYKVAAASIDQIWQGSSALTGLAGSLPGGGTGSSWSGKCPRGYFFQPNKTKLLLVGSFRNMIRNAPRANIEMNRRMSASRFGTDRNKLSLLVHPNAFGKFACESFAAPISGILGKKSVAECDLNATRLIVAIQAYRETEGKLPDALQALVPLYLPTIPVDPYDGKPFRYSAAKGIVYSVGKDYQDAGGSTGLPSWEKKSVGAKVQWNAEDIVFEIAPKPAPLPAPPAR